MKRLVLVYLAVRVLMLALTLLNGRLPYAEGARWLDERDDGLRFRFADHRLLDAHVRWDGKAYLHIASLGYDNARDRRSNTAFFAGYPWMTRAVHALLMRPLLGEERGTSPESWIIAGLLVNTACFLGALVLLVHWVRRRYGDERLAHRAGLLLILGPASFVFHITHSESAFLFFVLGAYLTVERGADIRGFCALAGASAVRLFGVALTGPLLMLAYQREGKRLARLGPRLLLTALPPLAIGAVLLRMAEVNGHVDAYFHQQRTFFGHATVPDWEGIAYLFRLGEKAPRFIVRDYYQVLHAVLAYGLMTAAFRREAGLPGRMAYLLTSGLLVTLPLISGEVISMPRYVCVAFPLYATAAGLLDESLRSRLIYAGSLALQMLAWVGWMHGWPLVT